MLLARTRAGRKTRRKWCAAGAKRRAESGDKRNDEGMNAAAYIQGRWQNLFKERRDRTFGIWLEDVGIANIPDNAIEALASLVKDSKAAAATE
jgi:hypothetical protein